MKLVLTADLHGILPRIPECDVLVVAGDVCPVWEHDVNFQWDWLDRTFRPWLENAPAENIVGIAGNHDYVFETFADKLDTLDLPWTYLRDSGVELDGVKFYGYPWVPNLPRWAFHASTHALQAAAAAIPADTDVLVVHGPPLGHGDRLHPRFAAFDGDRAGDLHIRDALDRVCPRLVVCGHIHEGYGRYQQVSPGWITPIYNVSHMNVDYMPVNEPVVVEL